MEYSSSSAFSIEKRSAGAARAMLRLVWNAPAGVSEKALPHDSGAGLAASHIWCVDLEKKLLTLPSQSLFTCHLLYIFIIHCTVVYLIKLYRFKSTSSSVSVVFLTEFFWIRYASYFHCYIPHLFISFS